MRRACRVALQLRVSSACSSSVAGPSQSIVGQQPLRNTVAMSSEDERLIQTCDFYAAPATSRKRDKQYSRSPELALTRIHEQLHSYFRVHPDDVMVELVLRLENEDGALISLLQKSPERWIPESIRCCGRALSSIQIESRRVIATRLWKQIEKRGLPISIDSINAHLRVNIENNEKWDPFETLEEIEEKRGLAPDQETFHILLEKLSMSGETDKCHKMLYEMSRRGLSPSDAISHSHLVYANAVRGYDQTVNSMIQQSLTKFGSEGEVLSLGAACVAAAAALRIDRLRELLNRSLEEMKSETSELSYHRLRLSNHCVFDIIWALSEKSGDKEMNNDAVIEEILKLVQRSANNFFRLRNREIDRHISSSHFRTSIILLEQLSSSRTLGISTAFSDKLLGNMCKAMVRSRMEKRLMLEMANRIETTLNLRRGFVHSELMLASLQLKDCDMDDRFSSFSSLLPIVDPDKTRPHLIFPMLAVTPTVEDRLKLLFRSSSLGYSNLETLDTSLMVNLLFQPMYKHQVWVVRGKKFANSPLEIMTAILHSFGISKASVWRMMQGWWKQRKEEEKGITYEMRMRPHSEEIQTWLRSAYSITFNDRIKKIEPTLPLTKTRLESSIEKGDASEILYLLSTHGWPEEVDLQSFAPQILDMLIVNESSGNIMKWLTALSRDYLRRRERNDEMMKSPLESHHILKVLRHRVNESEVLVKELIEMTYELKRLFPQAIVNDNSLRDVISESSKFFIAFFTLKDGTKRVHSAEETIELLRIFVKLRIVRLSRHGETVTPYCIIQILDRFDWKNAVNMWLRFQSSFSFANGFAILLSHSFKQSVKVPKEDVQFVVHKAHSVLSPSRVHSLYAAVLLNRKHMKDEESLEYFKNHGSEISPSDSILAYRLIDFFRFPRVDKYFIRTFPALCLAHTKLAEDEEYARAMLNLALLYCEYKVNGPLIAEMCDLFAQYGIEPDEKEKIRVEKTMEAHQKLVNRWILSPDGFIQTRVDQELIKEDEWKKYVRAKDKDGDRPEILQ